MIEFLGKATVDGAFRISVFEHMINKESVARSLVETFSFLMVSFQLCAKELVHF